MENEIVIHNEQDLRSKIYTIRGMQVMLDFDLAEIYGYSTKRFNEQVKNNIEKFDSDFRFQLTWEELEIISLLRSRSKISTLNTGRGSNVKYLPYAFTEQGIYMLMTVLRGDMAVQQSKMLIRLFKGMKDFIIEREHLVGYDEVAKIAVQTAQNTENILEHSKDIERIDQKILEIATIIDDFSNTEIKKDFLFLNGRSVEADIAYQKIYSQAKETIFVIDNYIGLKTLVLLKSVPENVKITIFTDNLKKGLHQKEYDDFCKEYPNVEISFKRTNGIFHDRYIIIDFVTENEIIYHCGASSKDAGSRVCSITTTADNEIYKPLIENLLKNQALVL
ncbi:ORF6N domain-containing protein [bacterium]|nr:ORF6N domain-containing protein [bacterium]